MHYKAFIHSFRTLFGLNTPAGLSTKYFQERKKVIFITAVAGHFEDSWDTLSGMNIKSRKNEQKIHLNTYLEIFAAPNIIRLTHLNKFVVHS